MAIEPSVFAEDSIWYKNQSSLQAEVQPRIPLQYTNTNQIDFCTSLDVDKTLSLSDVTNAALCNNPQTRELWANARVQVAQLGVARSAYLPSVTDIVNSNVNVANPRVSARDNPYSNLNNNIVASYLLYDFGNRDAALENARQLLQAASATQSATLQTILLNTVTNYYQVQAGLASVDAAIISEKSAKESFNAAAAKYKAGISTPADKLQAQTAYAQATLARISAEGNLKTSYGNLANVMGLSASTELNIKAPTQKNNTAQITLDVVSLINEAIQRRPDLIASEAQVKAAEASILASQAAAKPTVAISMSNSWQEGTQVNSNNTSSLGLTLTIPIFSGYSPSYRIQSAIANADIKMAQRDRIKLQVSLDVWTAFHALRTAIESMNASNTLVESASESSRVTLGRYKAGVGNIIDTLNAQSALATAYQQQIQATLNWNIARTSLAQAIGGLDNAMVISLPQPDK